MSVVVELLSFVVFENAYLAVDCVVGLDVSECWDVIDVEYFPSQLDMPK